MFRQIIIGTMSTALLTMLSVESAYAVKPKAPLPAVIGKLVSAEGKDIGSVTLTESKNGVLVQIKATGFSEGSHAVHFHEKGECRAPDFKTAGGHFSPTKLSHGFLHSGNYHQGDMPNQEVGADGEMNAEIFNPNVSLSADRNALLDDDGSALIIHAKADDYLSQPSGAAGKRVACAVFK